MNHLTDLVKRNASTILTFAGAGGVITTVVLAVKATPRAMLACTDAQVEKGRNQLTKMEIVKAGGPAFIPTAAVGVGTLICFFGANALSRRQQASLMSAYAALESVYQGYRQKVGQILGPETDRMIDKAVEQEKKDAEAGRPPWDEKQTFYLECCEKPSFFERTMEQVMRAEYHINRNLQLRGSVTLNEFLSFLDLKPVEKGDAFGWELYDGEAFYGYQWIDFIHSYRRVDDDLMVCSIDMPFPPHPLNGSEWMFSRENSIGCYENPT